MKSVSTNQTIGAHQLERLGAGVVEQVSLDLRREFPQEDGFSARNLHYMKQWYLYYTTEASKLQRPIAEIVLMTGIEVKSAKLQRPVAELKEEKLQRPIGELVKQPVSETENYPNDEFPLPFAPDDESYKTAGDSSSGVLCSMT